MNLAKKSWWCVGLLVGCAVVFGAWYAVGLAQEEGERGQREERRGETRREVREGPEREGREREERVREERENAEGERRERAENRPTERELLQHRIEVLRMAMPALMEAERRDAAEVVERAVHAYQMEQQGRRDDEAHRIRERAPSRAQLAEILRMASGLWREFDNEEKAAVVGRLAMELGGEGRREPNRQQPQRREAEQRERTERPAPEWMQRRRELEEQARRIKHAIEELRDDQDEEARKLQAELREITALLDRQGPAERAPEAVRERVEEANELRRALANAMREGQEERVNAIKRELEELMRDWEGARPARPQARPDVQREIEELRGQVRQLQGHMREMHQRMERIQDALESLADDDDDEHEEEGDGEHKGDEDEEHEEEHEKEHDE